MRIIGGTFRGRALAGLGKGDEDARLRPTTDRVRENIFNLLLGGRFGDPVSGARVLDLFAGTGALGLEALSRGAAHVSFVEKGARACALIERNIALCHAQTAARLLRRDACKPGPCPGAPFTLVFLDPPYGRGLGQRALSAVRAGGWIAPGALVVWEESAPMPAPEGFTALEDRRYGDSHITLLRAANT